MWAWLSHLTCLPVSKTNAGQKSKSVELKDNVRKAIDISCLHGSPYKRVEVWVRNNNPNKFHIPLMPLTKGVLLAWRLFHANKASTAVLASLTSPMRRKFVEPFSVINILYRNGKQDGCWALGARLELKTSVIATARWKRSASPPVRYFSRRPSTPASVSTSDRSCVTYITGDHKRCLLTCKIMMLSRHQNSIHNFNVQNLTFQSGAPCNELYNNVRMSVQHGASSSSKVWCHRTLAETQAWHLQAHFQWRRCSGGQEWWAIFEDDTPPSRPNKRIQSWRSWLRTSHQQLNTFRLGPCADFIPFLETRLKKLVQN